MLETGKIALNMRLKRRWEEKMQNEHRDRVVDAQKKIYIDNKAPPVFKHLEYKPKRIQLEEGKLIALLVSVDFLNRTLERFTEIER
jgi:hypothetical protein